jgi:hypothetical protein
MRHSIFATLQFREQSEISTTFATCKARARITEKGVKLFKYYTQLTASRFLLNATSMLPRFLLIASSDFEANRGGAEEALRRIRGEIDVRPTFCKGPSQEM